MFIVLLVKLRASKALKDTVLCTYYTINCILFSMCVTEFCNISYHYVQMFNTAGMSRDLCLHFLLPSKQPGL